MLWAADGSASLDDLKKKNSFKTEVLVDRKKYYTWNDIISFKQLIASLSFECVWSKIVLFFFQTLISYCWYTGQT